MGRVDPQRRRDRHDRIGRIAGDDPERIAATAQCRDRSDGAGTQRVLEREGLRQSAIAGEHGDRKSVVSGKSVSVRVDLGGRRIINKKKNPHKSTLQPAQPAKTTIVVVTSYD